MILAWNLRLGNDLYPWVYWLSWISQIRLALRNHGLIWRVLAYMNASILELFDLIGVIFPASRMTRLKVFNLLWRMILVPQFLSERILQSIDQFLDQLWSWHQLHTLLEVFQCSLILRQHLSRLSSDQVCLDNIDAFLVPHNLIFTLYASSLKLNYLVC